MLNFSSIYVDHVHYTWFGRQQLSPLLSNINLSVKRGEMTALVGGSGEGKSLLLQTALALLPDNLRMRGKSDWRAKRSIPAIAQRFGVTHFAIFRRASVRSTPSDRRHSAEAKPAPQWSSYLRTGVRTANQTLSSSARYSAEISPPAVRRHGKTHSGM